MVTFRTLRQLSITKTKSTIWSTIYLFICLTKILIQAEAWLLQFSQVMSSFRKIQHKHHVNDIVNIVYKHLQEKVLKWEKCQNVLDTKL